VLLLPEHVGARQRGMAAEIHLAGGSKPAQIEAIEPPNQKGGLGQVHFPSHLLHPPGVSHRRQQANRRGVAGEGLIGKRIDLGEPLPDFHPRALRELRDV